MAPATCHPVSVPYTQWRPFPGYRPLVLALCLALFAGCTSHPRLLLTEVGLSHFELYLDQRDPLPLERVSLNLQNANGHQASIDLVGTLPGRGFLVVIEELGYSGPPEFISYTAPISNLPCSGIRVAQGTFNLNLGDSFVMQLKGDSGKGPGGIGGLFHSRWSVEDTVAIGPRPRPAHAGNFVEDTTTPLELPVPPSSVSRHWTASGPRDTHRESDWSRTFPNYCQATR